MGNSKSLPKSKSAEQLSLRGKKKKKAKKAQDAHTSCPDITSGAVPYNNQAEEENLRVNYKLYQSYGDLNFTSSDSMPNLRFYPKSNPYGTMPRSRQSESVVPLMNGNTKSEVMKRHLSEGTALTEASKRRAISKDSLDGRDSRSGSLGRRKVPELVRFPSFREIAKKVRHFQETYQLEFAKQFSSVDCVKCLSRIQVAQSLVMPMWKVSVKDYLEDDDTLHMVERMMAQGSASITLPKALFSMVQYIRTLHRKEKNLWLPLARDIIDYIAKETSTELGRVYEYQISMLEPMRTVELLAKHAVSKIYLSVIQGKHWLERNAVLHTVVQGGTSNMEGTRMIFSVLIGSREYKWPLHQIFLKPGIRTDVWGEEGLLLSFYTDHKSLEPRVFGYRGVLYDWNYKTKSYSVVSTDSRAIEEDEEDSVFSDVHQGYIPYRRVLGTSVMEQYLKVCQEKPTHLKDFLNKQNNLIPPGPDRAVDPVFCVRSEEDIETTNWNNTDWANVDLSRIQIKNGNLRGASFRGACLMGANLENSNLSGANINYSDLSYSDVQGAQVPLSDLQSTNASYLNIGVDPRTTEPGFCDSGIHSPEEVAGQITDSKGNLKSVPQVVDDIEKRGIALITATPPSKPSRGAQESPDSGIARSESGIRTQEPRKLKVQKIKHSKSAAGERPRVTKVKRNQSDLARKDWKDADTPANILDDIDRTSPVKVKVRGINTIIESDSSPEHAPVVKRPPTGRKTNTSRNNLSPNNLQKPGRRAPRASPEESPQSAVLLRKPINDRIFKMIDSSPSRSSQLSVSPSRLSPALSGSDPDLRMRSPLYGDSNESKKVSLSVEATQQDMVARRPWLPTDPKRRSFPLMKAPVPLPETNLSKLEGDLPQITAGFTGRNTEVRQICKMLGQDERLVILHGEPAVGKSSVAIAAAHEARILLGKAVFYANVRGSPTLRNVIMKFMDQLGLRLNTDDLSMFFNWMNSHKDQVLFVVDNTNLFRGDPKELCTFVDDLFDKLPNLSIILCGTEQSYKGRSKHEMYKISELEEGGGDIFRMFNPDVSIEDAERYARMCGNNPASISLIAKAVKCGALAEDSIEGYLDSLGLNLAAVSVENIASRIAVNQGMVMTLIVTTRAVLAVLDTLRDSEKRLIRNLTIYPCYFNQSSAEALTWPNADDNDAEYATPFPNLIELGLIEVIGEDRYVIQETVRNVVFEHFEGDKLNPDLYKGDILKQLEECINIYHSPKWEQALEKYCYIRDDVESVLGRLSLDLSLHDSIHILEVFEGAIFLYEVLSDDLYKRTYLNLLELAVSTDNQSWEMSVECCLAYSLIKKNKFSDAKNHTDRAFEIFNEIQNTATPSYKSFCLLMKGIVSANTEGKTHEALELVKTALDIEKETIKMKKVLTLCTFEEYAKINKKMGRTPLARHYYNIGDYILGEITGPHPTVLDGYKHREEIWSRMLLFNRATEVARIAAEVTEKAYLEHPITADAQANLCECILRRGILIDAFDAAASALALRKRLLGSHPDTALSYKTVAYLYLRMDHDKEAQKHAEKALEIMKEINMEQKYQNDVQTLIDQVNLRISRSKDKVVQIRPSSPKSAQTGETAV